MGRKIVAYAAPFVIFMLLVGLRGLMDSARIQPGGLPAMYLILPLQTLVCAGALAYFWREYRLRAPRGVWAASAAGLLAFVLWIAPQRLFHQPPRVDGFDPAILAAQPVLYWGSLVMRFARLVLVVPVMEELFWRGLLLRYLVNEEFDAVPFGTYTRVSNAVVAVGFMLEHQVADFPAALATGVLYNFVAYRTRSLSSCILAHALTNALLGAYIMATHQWGFW